MTDERDHRYRVADLQAFSLGREKALLVQREALSATIVPSAVVGYLQSCRTFQDERSIVERMAQSVALPRPVAAVMVRDWIDGGFLVSSAQVRKRLVSRLFEPAEASESHTRSIATIGFVTHNRVALLSRALRSYAEHVRERTRVPRFVIGDDAKDVTIQALTRQTVTACEAELGIQCDYLGPEEKSRLASDISERAGVPLDVVRFAICDQEQPAIGTGGNRNALLLTTQGELVLSADDDTVARVWRAPHTSAGLSLCSEKVADEIWFFDTRDDALRWVPEAHADLLGAHEALLAQPLRSCVERALEQDELMVETGPRLADALVPQAYVAATLTGVLGDSGVGAPSWFLTLEGPSFERLIASDASYRRAFASREVLRCAQRATITSMPVGMATVLGVDNRNELPPFFPVGRNEDGLFLNVLRLTSPNAYIGHVPLAVLHAPPMGRDYPPDAVHELSAQRRISSLVALACSSCLLSRSWAHPNRRLRGLGEHLTDLGSLRRSEFEYVLWTQLIQEEAQVVASLERRLDSVASRSDLWARDVITYISALRSALRNKDCLDPADLRGSDRESRLEEGQRLVRLYGLLLSEWSSITVAAKELREAGHPRLCGSPTKPARP